MTNKKYLIYLINPKQEFKHYAASVVFAKLLGKTTTTIPLSLPTLAAFVPDNYEIKIIDEEIESLPKKLPDIVGITSITSGVKRAYEIADYYRSKNIPVLMGGSYISFKVEEALQHCTSVVIGEADAIFPDILKDFEKGCLKPTYKEEKRIDFKKMPMPRWDLVNIKNLMTVGVQVSRGCPFNCDFCIVYKIFDRNVRFREIDDVINEIKVLAPKTIFFVDDNLMINKTYAREFMKKLKPLGVTWLCQASIEVADDEDLLKDMYEAGCMFVLMGFESINPKSLVEARIGLEMLGKYEKGIEKIHKAGMQIMASFVVGFDNDTLEDFDRIYEFTLKNNLPFIILTILTANPGSDLYDRMIKEARITDTDLSIVNGANPCLHYMNMSQMDMLHKYHETLAKIYSYETIYKKTMELLKYDNFKKVCQPIKDVTFFQKFTTFFTLVNRFYFSKDKIKKKLFVELFKLGKDGKMSFDKIVFYLLSAEGFAEDIRRTATNLHVLEEKISKVDKGPWSQMKK